MGKILKKLDVILVEDNPSDVKLLMSELSKVFSVSMRRVEISAEFISELEKRSPDIILSDYMLPTFDGMSALKIRNTRFPDIPFILVTGSMNEETAVEVMKAGAEDYIIKEHLARINSAINAAIRKIKIQKEKELFRKKLEESLETFQNIFDNSTVAIYVQDEDGTLIDVNHAAVNLYGYEKEYLIGKTPVVVDAPGKNDLNKIWQILKRAFEGEPSQFEFWAKRKNGEIFPKIVSVEKGKYFGKDVIFAYAFEITDFKRNELIKTIQYNIAREILAESEFETLFGKVKEELSRLIETKNFIVALYDEGRDSIRIPFVSDEKEKVPGEIPVGTTLTGFTIKSGKTQILLGEDIEKMKKSGKLKNFGTVPEVWIGVPMSSNSKVLGVIVIQSYSNRSEFKQDDIAVLELVANQLSIFLEKKRTEDELAEYRKSLEKKVAERTAELEEKNRDLERYNKAFRGREFRIKELRDQVDELKKRLGEEE